MMMTAGDNPKYAGLLNFCCLWLDLEPLASCKPQGHCYDVHLRADQKRKIAWNALLVSIFALRERLVRMDAMPCLRSLQDYTLAFGQF